ncbi:MAG: ribosome small subunit-dependent GTPase A [Paludibacteraceae bacterium]|jgi:ribosome biogenesis GTPase|nr:ribosome small subunit-dependent GTPase A [Paludibacteraceae bacterium]MBO5863677.1 ribosome small subunit-dependent GTPase A [Paludibacteraceae bacterium]MBO5989932.1 ribosome small subunit-dependent GTPase A [Paludibacteraceae bacterium]
MQGLVIRNTGSFYQVKTSDGEIVNCRIKGKFRIQGIKSTNPVAVGDYVTFSVTPEGEGLISEIAERKNYVVRRPANLSKQRHIIAANVDQALLIVTVNYPETSTTFIDRFLATCEAYRVPAKIIINKKDLYSEEELEYMRNLMFLYEQIGYQCFAVSALTGEGVEDIRSLLSGSVSLLSGNSGVGKSSLINAVCPDFKAKTGEISEIHNKGMHTTTFSEMFELDEGTYLIDTPGIKGFGTIDFEKEEVGHFFPEIFRVSKDCRFGNCTHVHEPGCAVIKAVEESYISQSRYNSYLSVMEDCDAGKYR